MSKNIHPVSEGFAVTPDDDADLSQTCRALYVGVSGNVKVTLQSGTAVTFVGLAAGVLHPITFTRVWENGTTATSILAFP